MVLHFIKNAHLHYYAQANANYMRQYKAVSGEDGLETTVLGLTFEVQEIHLMDQGKLTLRCVASVGPSSSTHNVHNNNKNNQYLPPRHNNPPPAASTASMGYGDTNYPSEQQQHIGNQVMETMEVRFESKHNSHFLF